VGNERGSAEIDHWSIYERLPDPIRRLLMYDGHNWKCGWVAGLVERFGPRKAGDLVARKLASQRQVTLLEFYGRDHPQVRR